ncbi:glycosyltransferase family 2 protein [Tepidibacillus sp. LV47]|uniref:glycosyltransferase family 2 protein n=1 Tax=Tepidibacillus sp. LV47 TaxID=3398228 RepID=UPI003AAF9C5C
MNQRPLVTILLAFYNQKKYIMDAIKSVLRQSYSNWQLILLDDGSTDGSQRRIQNKIKDKRIIYKRFQYNRGKARVLNDGLKLADGEFIMELDGDDWLFPDALLSFIEYTKKLSSNVSLVYSNYITVKKANNKKVKKIVINRPFVNRIDWIKEFFVPTPRFYRKEALIDIGGWPTDYPSDGRLYEDVAIVFKLLNQYQMAYLPKTTMVVRRRYDSITYTNRFAWKFIYKYLLARGLQEWKEPYLVNESSKNSIQIKKKTKNMVQEPLVTLIVHYQNHEKYIPYFLQSIFHQNYSNIELIFVNDHSVDDSTEQIQSLLLGKLIPFRVITLVDHTGEGWAFHEAIKFANGNYALFLSPFELLNPEAIEIWVQTFKEKEETGTPLAGAFGDKKIFQSSPIFQFIKNETYHPITDLQSLFQNKSVPTPCMYRVDLLKQTKWPMDYLSEGKYFSELFLIARLMERGSFLHIPKFLILHIAGEIMQQIEEDYWPVQRIIIQKFLKEKGIDPIPFLQQK